MFWGATTKIGLSLALFLCILGYFVQVNVQNGTILGGCKNSNIFGGMPDIPGIFFFWGGGANS